MGIRQDYVKELVISQLGDAPSYNAILEWLADNYDQLNDILAYIATINIFEARGVWLDLIGVIVGQSREIPQAIAYKYFGYRSQSSATGYAQARYRKASDPLAASSILPDDEYRQVILARVARNWGDISEPGVVEGLQNIVNTNSIFIKRQNGGGQFSVYIGSQLSSNTRAIIAQLDIIPRGAGIGIEVVSSGEPAKTFGYRNQVPGYSGYGVGSYAKRVI